MNLSYGSTYCVTLWHWRFSIHPWILWSTAGKWDAFAALLWTYFEIVFHDVFTNGKQVHKALTHLSWESPRVIPTKSFHTAWSSMASLVSLVLSSPVSALVVSMYVVLGLPPFWQPGNKDVLPVVAFLHPFWWCAQRTIYGLCIVL